VERVEHDHGVVSAPQGPGGLGVVRPWQSAQSTTLAGEHRRNHCPLMTSHLPQISARTDRTRKTFDQKKEINENNDKIMIMIMIIIKTKQ
jgi:hypothetical protein